MPHSGHHYQWPEHRDQREHPGAPGETQLVRLSIGELEAGSYRFEARGISPLSFLESTELQYKHKVNSDHY